MKTGLKAMPTENLTLSVEHPEVPDSRRDDHRHGETAILSWDRFGIWLSSLCVVHCALTPLLLLLVPIFGAASPDLNSSSETFHLALAALLLPVAFVAFFRGYRHHGDVKALALGVSGVSILLFALAIHELGASLLWHTLVNIAGSVLLIIGHLRNRRLCQRCAHAH